MRRLRIRRWRVVGIVDTERFQITVNFEPRAVVFRYPPTPGDAEALGQWITAEIHKALKSARFR